MHPWKTNPIWFQFEPYQGAGQGGNNEPDLGLGGSVVVNLISELPGPHN